MKSTLSGLRKSIAKKIKNAPTKPGVYIFYAHNDPLYVGKAANLKNRLKSYLKIADFKTKSLHQEATRLTYLPLRSEIEALIEESRLIKKLKPKYNILWRDDKSYYYVYFTKEAFPKIFISHQNPKPYNLTAIASKIGPFTDGGALRLTLKIIRRYFPYCTCLKPHWRNCLNTQIARCLGYCCQRDVNVTRRLYTAYRKNITAIKAILRGQSKKLLKTLKDKKEKETLEKIFEHREYLMQQPTINSPLIDELVNLQPIPNSLIKTLNRIECYDISNFAGKEAVGAMTVMKISEPEDAKLVWNPDKSQWRKFKIKSTATRNDPQMIAEILKRRLKHAEWPYPDLIIIDGGKTQYNAAKKILNQLKTSYHPKTIKLISLAKPQKLVYGLTKQPLPLNQLSVATQQLIEQAIYQTHNFVIRYHRKLRNKNFLT